MAQNETLPPYEVHIVGRNVNVTEALKNVIKDKTSKLTRFSKRIIDIHVSIEVQKLEHRTDIVLTGNNHLKIVAHATSEDMYASIDKAIDRLERQLRRYEKRLREHDAKPVHEVDLQVNVIRGQSTETEEANEDIEEQNVQEMIDRYKFHEVVEKETLPLATLRLDEAVMKMELSGDSFRVFKGEDDQKIKVIYRRKDNYFGLIELDGSI